MDTIILYHQNCHDGYTAALVAYKYYSEILSDDDKMTYGTSGNRRSVYFIDVNPNNLSKVIRDLINQYPTNKTKDIVEILSFDVGFTKECFETLNKAFESVKVFDHHKSTLDNFLDRPSNLFLDMTISGAMLAYKYFYPMDPVPMLVQYVQDRDLWTYKLENSREVTTFLYDHLKWTYTTINSANKDSSECSETSGGDTSENAGSSESPKWFKAFKGYRKPDFKSWMPYLISDNWVYDAVQKGKQMIENIEKFEELSKKVCLRIIKGKKVGVCQATIHVSQLGESLYKARVQSPKHCTLYEDKYEYLYDYVVLWRYDFSDSKIKVSLRSRYNDDHTGVDVSIVAKEMKGGGHAGAAGFECSDVEFLEFLST